MHREPNLKPALGLGPGYVNQALGFVSYGIELDACRQLGESYSSEYMGLRLR